MRTLYLMNIIDSTKYNVQFYNKNNVLIFINPDCVPMQQTFQSKWKRISKIFLSDINYHVLLKLLKSLYNCYIYSNYIFY